MKIPTLFLLIVALSFTSCETKIEKFAKPSANQNLGKGEWLDSSDTVNGISNRFNKVVFFKNLHFIVNDAHPYQIMDSIHKQGEKESKVGEYLFVINEADTAIYKIVKRDKKAIVLLDEKQIQKTYNFWKH